MVIGPAVYWVFGRGVHEDSGEVPGQDHPKSTEITLCVTLLYTEGQRLPVLWRPSPNVPLYKRGRILFLIATLGRSTFCKEFCPVTFCPEGQPLVASRSSGNQCNSVYIQQSPCLSEYQPHISVSSPGVPSENVWGSLYEERDVTSHGTPADSAGCERG